MRIHFVNILEKLKRKNRGNVQLIKAVNDLIETIEHGNWKNPLELIESRPDADRIHSEGFYFFNIKIHRTLILIEFDDESASVVWAGSHQDYEKIFQNNKSVIEKWLRNNGWIKN